MEGEKCRSRAQKEREEECVFSVTAKKSVPILLVSVSSL